MNRIFRLNDIKDMPILKEIEVLSKYYDHLDFRVSDDVFCIYLTRGHVYVKPPERVEVLVVDDVIEREHFVKIILEKRDKKKVYQEYFEKTFYMAEKYCFSRLFDKHISPLFLGIKQHIYQSRKEIPKIEEYFIQKVVNTLPYKIVEEFISEKVYEIIKNKEREVLQELGRKEMELKCKIWRAVNYRREVKSENQNGD